MLAAWHLSDSRSLLDAFMVLLTVAGPLVFLGIAARAWQRGERRLGLAILAAIAASVSGALLLQWLTGRPRPDDVRLVLGQIPTGSFPSGHVALSLSATWVIALQRRNMASSLGLGALSLGIALSRVYLGHHHPTDALAGALLGSGVGAAAYGLVLTEDRGLQRLGWLVWCHLGLVATVTVMAYLRLIPHELVAWPYADRVMHFLLFGAVTYLANLWCRDRRIGPGLPLALLLPFGAALLEESAQGLSPARTADPLDLACDLAGMTLAWWLSARQLRRARTA